MGYLVKLVGTGIGITREAMAERKRSDKSVPRAEDQDSISHEVSRERGMRHPPD